MDAENATNDRMDKDEALDAEDGETPESGHEDEQQEDGDDYAEDHAENELEEDPEDEADPERPDESPVAGGDPDVSQEADDDGTNDGDYQEDVRALKNDAVEGDVRGVENDYEKLPERVRHQDGNHAKNNINEEELYSHMSTNVDVTDVEALRQAIADVRSDANGVNRKSWIVVGHVDNNPNLLEVKGHDTSEEANLEEFRELLEDDQVMYALVRTTTTVDMSATVRFVYVHWIGEQVPFVKRGRYGVVHGSVESYFNPYHVVIETGNSDDLTEEELIRVLEEKSMTVSKVVETPTDRRHERGFTQHQQKQKTSSIHPKTVPPVGNQVEVTPELHEAIGEVRKDSSNVTWLLAEYQDNNIKKPLTVVSKGSGGINQLKEYLNNEHVQYGLLRTTDNYDDIQTVKFVYIYWIGEDVKPMVKGKVYANAGAVEQIFSPIHVTLSFTSMEEITEETVKDKVAASSGSKSFVK